MKVQRHTISTVKSTLQVQFSTISGHLIEISLFLDLDRFRDRRSLISPARLTLIGDFSGHEQDRFLENSSKYGRAHAPKIGISEKRDEFSSNHSVSRPGKISG